MTVAELQSRMSFAEFSEWLVLLGVEPWGPYREDCLSALGRHAALTPWAKEPIKISDLIPKWGVDFDPKAEWEKKASKLAEKARAALDG
jgi:hypothetical protein